ncbi:hypothetical protein LTR47_011220 [Exophiala xenobiotica]|nr:hypothetical protein LTR92_011083 [Exophiala xenobiotica]KAK5220354.1 hypothetical protein LTR47_011220 [Exophiala xenobiotica]KAK5245325.1 hypothetical protein LTS06_009239 [Exophiala xenobiotica]KAK5313468.1 hypothetical protein LTR93_010870 [Exophiala xenobiotica]KAK5357995.1 hypothetical protein LTR11_011136 [Exophiala xenobiotica]
MDATNSADYCPIADYGLIGDMHTCALISKTGSLDFMCWPAFDSPSIFCRLLDKDKGGYFSIRADLEIKAVCKQNYMPCTYVLSTRWTSHDGIADVLDYFPVAKSKPSSTLGEVALSGYSPCRDPGTQSEKARCHSGVVRNIRCLRGVISMAIEVFPAFNHARDEHQITLLPTMIPTGSEYGRWSLEVQRKRSMGFHLETKVDKAHESPVMQFEIQEKAGLKGPGLYMKLKMCAEQSVTFIVHSVEIAIPKDHLNSYIGRLEQETYKFWTGWTRQCTFRGHYREQVEQSLLILKLLTYIPTGAIVVSPTFSLLESVGGSRIWDYRYSWLRDTTFTLYVFLENGYSEEAESYMRFIYDSVIPSIFQKAVEGGKELFLPIVLTIRGEHEMPEVELDHFEGYRGSKHVRIGNVATSHTQLDTYGALLDAIYLYNKFAGPISYDQWLGIRRIVNHVITLRDLPDMSIWEVRGERQNFVFSKIMLWVTLDRALRLSDKRSNLPCPDRTKWVSIRDELYEGIMKKGFNSDGSFFCMSYENRDVLDASILIAPLVLFIAPDDPRFLSTLYQIMNPREQGGLTSAKLVARYDHKQDVIQGEEGAFTMVTFWLIEAMSRASMAKAHLKDHPRLLELLELRETAMNYFDNVLSFGNNLGIFSEEVGTFGEHLGSISQAFSFLHASALL